MSDLYWSHDAETDLDDITAYIARDDVRQLSACATKSSGGSKFARIIQEQVGEDVSGALGNWSSRARPISGSMASKVTTC